MTGAIDDATAESASDSRQGIQSVEVSMHVLEAIERGLGPMSLGQIAAATGMSNSKVHRYLVSLCRIGLVSQEHRSAHYDLGPGMRRLGVEALRRMDEVGLAEEYLPQLRDRTLHAVNLAVWGDSGPVIIRWVSGGYALPITVRIGSTLPMLTSAVGRVYLAYLPRTMTAPIVEEQLAKRGQPMPSVAQMDLIREEVQRQGFASTSDGVLAGVASIAAPVFTSSESIPLAVAIVFPAHVAHDDSMPAIADDLVRTTRSISAELGGHEHRAQ